MFSISASVFQKELDNLYFPTQFSKNIAEGNAHHLCHLNSDFYFESVHKHRLPQLYAVVNRVHKILMLNDILPEKISFLAGDSHNGGKRPFLIETAKEKKVIKFADPRPYLLLREILLRLSSDLDIDLTPPNIHSDENNEWYIIPFIDNNSPLEKSVLKKGMFALGALTAVAFCIGMVDIHVENLVMDGNKPIIIDPECIFYHFGNYNTSERLLNTGLVGHNQHLSAMRGGDTENVPIFEFDPFIDQEGQLNYRKPIYDFSNRFTDINGKKVDPKLFRNDVVKGYKVAFNWFCHNLNLIQQIVNTYVADDFRIRVLARKTRHYSSVIHMLNMPIEQGYTAWETNILSRFMESGSLLDHISPTLLSTEIYDLKKRDIPYFWANAGQHFVFHSKGVMQKLPKNKTPIQLITEDFSKLREHNIDEQIKTLDEFLT